MLIDPEKPHNIALIRKNSSFFFLYFSAKCGFFIRCYVKDGSYYHVNSKAIVKWFYNVKSDWHFYIPNHIVNELTDYSGEEEEKNNFQSESTWKQQQQQ